MKTQYIRLGIASLLTLILGSCSQDAIDGTFPQETGKEIVFSTSIMQTRTQTTDRKTVFVDEDHIGVFVLNRSTSATLHSNLNYLYKENAWSSETPVTFPLDGSDVNFYAYYPYAEGSTATVFDFTVSTDQAANGLNPSDLLLAENVTSEANDEAVTLSFTHALALLEVKVTLPAGVKADKVILKAHTTASVDLKAQTATVKSDVPVSEITLMRLSDDTFRGVVPAQELSERCIKIIGDNGASYRYTADSPTTLQANSINTITAICQ
ncbi:fimbrillin family protein [Bacteroides congonensis]|uniref:fimbrillin family protein n=1 Tax=Bacteroides congonensis TaxID=1871006 RepID=UPI002675526F|nr:fimbrillin family protein [Bacteroides congonensis]